MSIKNPLASTTLTRVSLLSAGCLLSLASEVSARGVPDIDIESVSGPLAAAAGANVAVTTKCKNFGEFYNGVLYISIRLSTDAIITEDDLQVDYDDFNDFFFQQNPVSHFKLPADLASGTYYWGSIVKKVGAEINLANNVKAGNKVVIDGIEPPSADLCLNSTESINIVHTIGGALPNPVKRSVENCGEAGSMLSWIMTGSEPAWVTASMIAGTTSKGPGQSISIQLLPSGLLPGLYNTTLRFENTENALDFESINVNFVVSTAGFTPGDTISGTTTSSQPTHSKTFLGAAGMKLKLSTKSLDKGLQLRVTVLDDQGAMIGTADLKKKGSKKKASITIPTDGLFTLVCETLGGTGDYGLKTKAK